MPTDLTRINRRPMMHFSSARNGSIVVIALTAALVLLQLVGLAKVERSHARPASLVQANGDAPARCVEPVVAPATQALYD